MRRVAAVLTGFTFLLIVPLTGRPAHAASHDIDRANESGNSIDSANVLALEKMLHPDLDHARDAYEAGDYAGAFTEYKALAKQGNAIAQFNLGIMYKKGRGVPKNHSKAVAWFRKAADQGDAIAQHQLGKMYMSGYGVQQSYVEAFKWYKRSAEDGYVKAQYRIGVMYKSGQGAEKNNVLAYMWFSVAVSRSYYPENLKASNARDAVATKMTPAEIAEAQRLAREWKPKNEK